MAGAIFKSIPVGDEEKFDSIMAEFAKEAAAAPSCSCPSGLALFKSGESDDTTKSPPWSFTVLTARSKSALLSMGGGTTIGRGYRVPHGRPKQALT